MFDRVILGCPWCHVENEEQTKDGACMMHTYHLNEEMHTTLGVLGLHQCGDCKKWYRVKLVTVPHAEIIKSEPPAPWVENDANQEMNESG